MAYLKLFTDALDKYRKLNDAEFGRLIRAALTYKATGVEVELMGREELLWDGIKIDIDRDSENYEAVCAKRSEAGKKGAEARWQKYSKNSKCHLPYSKNGQDKEEDKDKDELASKLANICARELADDDVLELATTETAKMSTLELAAYLRHKREGTI